MASIFPEPVTTGSPRPRMAYLDCLRGLAAVAVMWFHYVLGAPGADSGGLAYFFTVTFDTGKVAVVVFFAISGFIVPESLRADLPRPLQRFAISRFFRLYPVYWISVIACVVIGDPTMHITLPGFLANITMVQGFLGHRDINGATWTLAIELVFYGLCVLLFCAGRLRSRHWQFGLLIVMLGASLLMGSVRFELGRKYPVAIPLAMSVMFFGCLWRGYLIDRDPLALRFSYWSMLCFLVLLPPICLLSYADLGEGPRYIVTYFVGLIVFALYTRYPFYTNRVLVHLGVMSYSIYVLHTPIWLLIIRLVGEDWVASSNLHDAVFITGTMACTLLLSYISYALVERPCIEAGRRLIRRTTGNASAVAQP